MGVMRVFRLLLCLVVCGCGGAAATRSAHVNARGVASAASSSAVVVTVASASASAAPPPVLQHANPRLFADLGDGNTFYFGDNRYMGFSEDDDYLGYEVSGCDPCPTEFHFTSPTKPVLDFGHYYNPGNPSGSAEKKQNADVERKLQMLKVHKGNWRALRGPFPYPDLVFATGADRNDFQGKVWLLFGARVVGYAPVFPMRVEIGPTEMFSTPMSSADQARLAHLPRDEREKELHARAAAWLLNAPGLAYANVTHDGSDIGAVAVATGTMWLEMGGVARMPVKAFASQVYNDTAMRFHRESKFAQAADLFEKAEAADPSASLFSYNLACAYARAKDARAKDALARAIQKDGETIKARARTDKDFADVSGEPWFAALVR